MKKWDPQKKKRVIAWERVTIEPNLPGLEPYTLRCEVIGEKTYGWDLPSGAWALYGQDGASPARFLLVRPFRKSRTVAYNVKRIIKREREK